DDDRDATPPEVLEDLVAEIGERLGLDVEIDVKEMDGQLVAQVAGDDVGLFIGRHGQTIDAIPHLARRIGFPEGPTSMPVVIDATGYGERRAEALRAEADDAADEALRLGEPIELDPLPPFERRIVHEYLRERGDVETHSEGDEPERYLVISPVKS